MDALRQTLLQSEPLLLFTVIGLGYLAGQIKVKGFSLGVAGVLFVGLFFGGWRAEGQADFAIAHQVSQLGLILFVYAVGLTSGPGFFASLRRRGIHFNIALVMSLLAGTAATVAAGKLLGLPSPKIAGVFCGGLTNTPALAAVTELLQSNPKLGDASMPAVGYSVAYPYGVIGGLLAFQLFAWVYRKPYAAEKASAQEAQAAEGSLVPGTFAVTNPALFNQAIGQLRVQDNSGLIISRHRRGGATQVPTKYTVLQEGDLVTAVGRAQDIQKGEAYFGAVSREELHTTTESINVRRILLSRKELVGKTLEDLELDRHFNAQVTRLRRADVDMIPPYDMPLELGDRLRVVAPVSRMAEITKYFGDSQKGITELDYTALTVGICVGVLVGMIPIPVPGGTTVSLGFAGGPLVMGLILGRIGRTGPLVWSLPYEASQTLSHVGLLFFLAGVGVMAGGHFFEALATSGWQLLVLGLLTTSLTTGLTLLLLRHYAKASVISAIGATSGMQTQPATLAKAYEMSQSNETFVAYATTYPVAMVAKILLAQIILLL